MMKKVQSTTLWQWLQDHFDHEQLKGLAAHGAASGVCPGLVTYAQTRRLYNKFENEIWKVLETASLSAGYVSILAFIGALHGSEHVVCDGHFKNLCVWFVAEEYARCMTESDSNS